MLLRHTFYGPGLPDLGFVSDSKEAASLRHHAGAAAFARPDQKSGSRQA